MEYDISNVTLTMNHSKTSLNLPPSNRISRNSLISFVLIISMVLVSFVGNSLTICVVLRKRFRSTSTGFYILCMAICDMLFMICWPLETTTKVGDTISIGTITLVYGKMHLYIPKHVKVSFPVKFS